MTSDDLIGAATLYDYMTSDDLIGAATRYDYMTSDDLIGAATRHDYMTSDDLIGAATRHDYRTTTTGQVMTLRRHPHARLRNQGCSSAQQSTPPLATTRPSPFVPQLLYPSMPTLATCLLTPPRLRPQHTFIDSTERYAAGSSVALPPTHVEDALPSRTSCCISPRVM